MEKATLKIEMLDNEYWYGGAVNDGFLAPFSKDSEYELDIDANKTYNQINPVYLSSKGRYIWLGNGGKVKFFKGGIYAAGGAELNADGKTLKDAVLNAAKKHYPPDGKIPGETVFLRNQYCSWIAMAYGQNQEGVLAYARSIIEKGLKPGILILDDCWQEDYGAWEFHRGRFPDPKAMLAELKARGFKVVFWLVPYISADSAAFRALREAGALLRNADGSILIADWWNGLSAALDFTLPAAQEWFGAQVSRLREKYGAEGFKLDGGDARILGCGRRDGNLQNMLWIDGVDAEVKEARACYKLGGRAVIQRLADKAHRWGVEYIPEDGLPDKGYYKYGLSTVVPDILTQGVTGYYYGCPDMVGGGLWSDFLQPTDSELIIRSCQAAALMPMMQFSLDVWNMDGDGVAEQCKKMIALRERFTEYILRLAKNAAATSEPIVRYLEYEFPGQGFERATDRFLLGDKYLVIPAGAKGQREVKVRFPKGKWTDVETGKAYEGGRAYAVAADLGRLPVFERNA